MSPSMVILWRSLFLQQYTLASTVERRSCREREFMQIRIPVLLTLVWDRCIDMRVPCRNIEWSTADDSIKWSAPPFASEGLNAKFRELHVDMLIEIF